MDRIEKALQKLSKKERTKLKEILHRIVIGDIVHMDVVKLKGRDDIYRVRKGDLRVMYRQDKGGAISILAIERRSDTTYNRI